MCGNVSVSVIMWLRHLHTWRRTRTCVWQPSAADGDEWRRVLRIHRWCFAAAAAASKTAHRPTTTYRSIVVIKVATIYTGWPKNWHHFMYALTLPNINRFLKLFCCQNDEKICNNTITKDPTILQVCRYTTLWNIKCLKSHSWKQDDVSSSECPTFIVTKFFINKQSFRKTLTKCQLHQWWRD